MILQKRNKIIEPTLCDITAIVATHERPQALDALVRTFRAKYPSLEIIAIDSSENPILRNDINHITVPIESGISIQRNRALEEVKTKLFVLLDDDFQCTEKTNLYGLMNFVLNKGIDIQGGAINNIGHEKYDFHGTYSISGNSLYHYIGVGNGNGNVDTIFNFFVGETQKILSIGGWDNSLKYAKEHDDFFLNAKEKGLIVAYNNQISVDHYCYKKFHGGTKGENCINYFFNKWKIDNKVEIRLIKNKGNKYPYISYHDGKKTSTIPEEILEKIRLYYGNYLIKKT